MANTDKNIVITPNNGSASDPNIVFSGANATTGAQNITLTVTPNNSGTVAFSGSAGQLLAINNDISNTLSTGGTISATGNITANNFVGNLVGNVTGNFSGSLANGNSNVNIPAANGNVNISAAGNANVVVVTGTGANVNGTLSVSGNANVGNIGATNGVFTNVSGNGSSLTSITGANVTGQVANALVSGTVYTAAQPNITSVGTLSSLSVSGTATLAAVNGTDASFSGNATVNGNLFVNGNLTYLNVETVAVEDPIIQLQTGANGAAPIANSGKDVGTALNYYDTAAKIAFMGWDVSNAEIAFGSNVSITNEVVTFTSLANTRSGNTLTTGVFATTLSATGNITAGNLIGIFANGNSNISIPAANGNINISAGGSPNEIVITSTGVNIAGTLNISGNTIGANIQALTFKTSGTVISPAFLQGATVNAAAGTAYGFLSRGTLAAQANGDALLGYDVSLGTANTGTTGLTGLTFYAGRFDGSSWSNSGNGTINNAYGVYASAPTIGTNNYAIFASGAVSVTGNLTAANLITGGVISSTGNITAGNLIGIFANGNSNVSIPAANGNINFSVGGQANEVVFTSTGANVNGYLSASGNANIANIGTGGLITATGNIDGGNLNTVGNLSVGGAIGVGTTALTGYFIRTNKSITGGASNINFNIQAGGAIQSDVTSIYHGFRSIVDTAASAFTLAALNHYTVHGIGTLGAGSAVTLQTGFNVLNTANLAVTNYGFRGQLAAAANNYNLYLDGTANNYIAGSLGIGSTSLGAINMRVSKSLTGGTTAFNFVSDGTIGSDVTTNAVLNRVVGQTQAATFTLTNLIYNQAVQGTFGLNSTVTTQSGFTADNTLTGATNNYGFRGSIASGVNRFNLYMDGTANNYSAGNLGIGTTSPAVALHVKQNGGAINVEGTDQAYIQFYPRTVANIRTAYIGVGSAGSNNFTIRNDDNGQLQLQSGNSNVSVFANGNVTTSVAGVANVVVVTSTGANIAGTLSATGNITGNFFIGNGSQLTGITTVTSLANGTSNVSIPAVNGNINFSIGGAANEVVFTSTGANVNGYLNVTGNANVDNIGAARGIFTTTVNTPLIQSGTSNITLTSGGNVSTFIAGNATAQLVVTATGANIPGTANIVGLVTGGNFTTTGANGTVTANNLTLTGAASGNVNVAATLSNLGLRTVAATYTDTAVTGTQANAAIHYIAVPTVTGGSNAKTYTNMATFHIAGPVTASTNATITTNYSLFVASGNSFFGGNLSMTGNITAGAGTGGTISGANLVSANFFTGTLVNGTSNVSIPAANGNVNISVGGSANEVVVTSTGANVNGYLNITGDTTFSGVGQRILGDFSNVTLASRTAFQDKTANSVTGINILPNGTATESALTVFNNSNAANSSYGSINGNATLVRIISATTGSGTALPLTFSTGAGGTEAARIDTSQNFLIGRTSLSNNISNVKGVSIVNDGRIITEQDYNTAGIPTAGLFTQNIFNSSGNVTNMVFYRNGTSVGTIVTTASATAYNTSSDYRLKSNTQPLTGSGAFIDALKPKTWTWIINGEPGIGFIAHEVAEVAPSTVFGEKDAVNEDGTPNHQAMEYGSAEFIAHIIAELQDLRRRFAELQTEVNNLKNP
jgi:hypothetical protein